jgi:hypothetical protein
MKNQVRSERKKSAAHSQAARRDEARQDGLLDWLFNWLDTSLVQQTGGELARECHGGLWAELADQLALMTPAKAREFVHEHAIQVVLTEVDTVMQRRRIRLALRAAIVAEAAEQLVELVAKDVARMRPQRRAGRKAA